MPIFLLPSTMPQTMEYISSLFQQGVFVSTSTRNSGMPNTATNVAPWIFIVAASSIDRSFKSNVLLKSNITLQGEAVNPITQNGFASLVLASNCAAPSVSQTNARSLTTYAKEGRK